MELKHFGLIIKVNDLDECRLFYRDLLELGEPVFDSTFSVVFALADNLMLTLEKSAAGYLEHASAAGSFCFCVSDLAAFAERLARCEYPLEEEPVRIGIREYRRGLDPEGNPFWVCEG